MVTDYASTKSAFKGVTSHGFDSTVRDCPPFPPPLCVCVRSKKKNVHWNLSKEMKSKYNKRVTHSTYNSREFDNYWCMINFMTTSS